MSEPLLQTSWLSVTLRGQAGPLPVIKGLDLRVERGEIVGLAGESGSGKSLTALTLLNLLPAGAHVDGSIRFDGTELLAPTRGLCPLGGAQFF